MSFDKFTDKARKVLVLAQDEARGLHQPYVGTEHILLGLIQEKEGLAAQALERLNIKYDAVVQAIRQVVTIDESADVSGHLSFTPRVKRVLENSLREAMQMGQSYISTEHLLLGIVREGEGTALDVLGRLGVKGDDIRGALNDLVGQSPVYAGRSAFDAMGPSPDSMLKEFGTDLTKKASDGKLDPVIGRAGEIERVMQVLSRRQKNNPLLIGEPGVGKTAVVEGPGAAYRRATRYPTFCATSACSRLTCLRLWRARKYRGEFEERLKKCIKEVHGRGRHHPVHRRDAHAHRRGLPPRAPSTPRPSSKPPLSRGEIQVIGATTIDEYRKHLGEGLRARAPLPAHHRRRAQRGAGRRASWRACAIATRRTIGVHFTDEALQAAVKLSDRYIQDRFLPDKAIDVIDEAGARMRIRNMTLPKELRDLDEKLREVRAEKDKRHRRAGLRDAPPSCATRKASSRPSAKQAEKQWEEDTSKTGVQQVTVKDIADVVSMTTGVPVSQPDRGRDREAAAHGKRAARARHRPGRGRDGAFEGHPPHAARA